jgi:hypothetical protein
MSEMRDETGMVATAVTAPTGTGAGENDWRMRRDLQGI